MGTFLHDRLSVEEGGPHRGGRLEPKSTGLPEHELILRLILAGKEFELLKEPLSVYRKANDESISRRSPMRTLTHQMALLNKLESFLVASGTLQNNHRRALEQTRFQAARTSYAHDREFADGLIRQIYQTNSSFHPRGDAAPLAYRVFFKMFGFKTDGKYCVRWSEKSVGIHFVVNRRLVYLAVSG